MYSNEVQTTMFLVFFIFTPVVAIGFVLRTSSFQEDQLGLSLLTLEQLESEEFQNRIQIAAQA